MTGAGYFPSDIHDAGERFRAACEKAGAAVRPYFAPEEEPAGQAPLVEATRIGPAGTKGVLVLTGGCWEDEGLCATGIQTGVLHEFPVEQLPAGVAIVAIHAVAPPALSRVAGRAAWPAPERQRWSHGALAAAEHRFIGYVAQRAAGAETPTDQGLPWQTQMVFQIAAEYLSRADRIALLDFRTGPADCGEVALLPMENRWDPDLKRAARLFGSAETGIPILAGGQPGDLAQGLISALGHREVTAAVMEFGTYSLHTMLAAKGRQIFYPAGSDWRERVWSQASAVIRRTLAALAR